MRKCLTIIIILNTFQFHLRAASLTINSTSTLCLQHERNVLLNFSSAFTFNNFTPLPMYNGSLWIPGTDCCLWQGVTCDPSTGHVVELNLCSNGNSVGIEGQLPSNLNSSALPRLSTILLYQNSLEGTIPTWLFEFPTLVEVYLSLNLFTAIGQTNSPPISQLKFFDVHNNMIQGPIPDIIFKLKTLQHLDLASNYLSITIPFTQLLHHFHNVTHLDLSNNHFTLHEVEDANNNTHVTSSHLQFEYLGLSSCNLKKFPSLLKGQQSLSYLDLSHNNIVGEVPTFIFEIKTLNRLFLGWNYLTGVIPLSKFHPDLEYLDISGNNMSLVDDIMNNTTTTTGVTSLSYPHQFLSLWMSSCNLDRFPSVLRGQRSLVFLDLSNNNLYGDVPKWLLEANKDSLFNLNLSSNHFGEPPPPTSFSKNLYANISKVQDYGIIPSSVCNLSALAFLDLSYNHFTGNLPKCLVNVVGNYSLTYLNLGHNQLSGTISPTLFKDCSWLLLLYLNNNNLIGMIPWSLASCSELLVLDLGNNKLHDTFPVWLGALPKLQILSLCSNNIYGSLLPNTDEKYLFPQLQILDISNNNLNGTFSESYVRSLTGMTPENKRLVPTYFPWMFGDPVSHYGSVRATVKGIVRPLYKNILLFTVLLDASQNQFQGHILDAIGSLVALTSLNLSHNYFTGHIPSSLSNLSQLQNLDLSSNELDGKIPEQLKKLNFLEVFNVSNNDLTGAVPVGNQFNTFDDKSYLGNPRLCGEYLTNKCGNAKQNVPVIDEGENVESSYLMGWLPVETLLIGFGCGIMIGLVGGYYLFLNWIPQWILRLACPLVESFLDKRDGSRKKKRRI